MWRTSPRTFSEVLREERRSSTCSHVRSPLFAKTRRVRRLASSSSTARRCSFCASSRNSGCDSPRAKTTPARARGRALPLRAIGQRRALRSRFARGRIRGANMRFGASRSPSRCRRVEERAALGVQEVRPPAANTLAWQRACFMRTKSVTLQGRQAPEQCTMQVSRRRSAARRAGPCPRSAVGRSRIREDARVDQLVDERAPAIARVDDERAHARAIEAVRGRRDDVEDGRGAAVLSLRRPRPRS